MTQIQPGFSVCRRLKNHTAFALHVVIALAASHGEGAKPCAVQRGVVYARPAGTSLRADLYVPQGGGPSLRPGVILIHGGAWAVGTRRQHRAYGLALAERGYVAMAIEYRVLPRYGFPHCVHDAKAAVRWLRLHAGAYRVDPDRIAVLGSSAGAYLAAMLAVTRPEDGLEGSENLGPPTTVQAIVCFYGPFDLTPYKEKAPDRWWAGSTKRYLDWFLRDVEADGGDPFVEASPIRYVHRDTCPVLLIHGTQDHLVSMQQSESFYARLRTLGVPARLIKAPGRGHGFDLFHPELRQDLVQQIALFLDEHLSSGIGPQAR